MKNRSTGMPLGVGLLLIIGSATIFLVAALMARTGDDSPTTPTVSVNNEPDCDFDDIVERDTDCGFTKPQKSISAKKSPAKRRS